MALIRVDPADLQPVSADREILPWPRFEARHWEDEPAAECLPRSLFARPARSEGTGTLGGGQRVVDPPLALAEKSVREPLERPSGADPLNVDTHFGVLADRVVGDIVAAGGAEVRPAARESGLVVPVAGEGEPLRRAADHLGEQTPAPAVIGDDPRLDRRHAPVPGALQFLLGQRRGERLQQIRVEVERRPEQIDGDLRDQAGEPGFEPGFTVLETVRIAINSLPLERTAMVLGPWGCVRARSAGARTDRDASDAGGGTRTPKGIAHRHLKPARRPVPPRPRTARPILRPAWRYADVPDRDMVPPWPLIATSGPATRSSTPIATARSAR